MQENNIFPDNFGFKIKNEDDEKFFGLCAEVYKCGLMAKHNQKHIRTTLKSDGTPVTESDLAITEALDSYISQTWPDCNRISEEVSRNVLKSGAKYTFIFDPIDGTASYSQGMPTWCIGIGILDSSNKPCAAVTFAPRMGIGEDILFICTTFNDDKVYLNGKELTSPEHLDVPGYITAGSNAFLQVDFSKYKGKIRSYGSSLLHIIGPCVWEDTDACLAPRCYVWDICSSHTIATKLGMTTKFIDGSDFVYSDSILAERKQIHSPIICGYEKCVSWMLDHFREI